MRSRYLPDGSIDYEADRVLEMLRHADEELERLQRQRGDGNVLASSRQRPPITQASNVSVPAVPTILDFLTDPIAELTQPLVPTLTQLPTTTCP